MIRARLIPVWLVALAVAMSSAAAHAQGDPGTIEYRIRPIPTGDRTVLEVAVGYRPQGDEDLHIQLPRDCYGTPDIHRYVTLLEGKGGATVLAGGSERARVVRPGTDGTVRLRYVLDFDPAALDAYTFAPSVGPRHFHLAGCQWMIGVGATSTKRPYRILVDQEPAGWGLYSSLGPEPRRLDVVASHEELAASAIGGGETHREFLVEGQPVSVFAQVAFDWSVERLLSDIEQLVRVQRDRMGDHSQPFYHVVILPRSGIVAGTAVDNMFVSFVKPDVSRASLLGLLSHELFHSWLPGRLRVMGPVGSVEFRHEWLTEGVTDYVAWKLLHEAGLVTREEFVASINRHLYDISDNPARVATHADLIQAARERRFGTAEKKLAYSRGALLALNWDLRLRTTGRGEDVVHLIRMLCDEAVRRNGNLSEDELFALSLGWGIDARRDFERHVLVGEQIAMDADALGPDHVLSLAEVPAFDPGFSISETLRARRLSGVVPGGPADRAGLRNGMLVIRMRNSNRFSNAWDPARPLQVVVSEGGTERTIEFFPYGAASLVPQFAPR